MGDIAEEDCKGWSCVNIAWPIAVAFVNVSQGKPTSTRVKSGVDESWSEGQKDVSAGIARGTWRCYGRVGVLEIVRVVEEICVVKFALIVRRIVKRMRVQVALDGTKAFVVVSLAPSYP